MATAPLRFVEAVFDRPDAPGLAGTLSTPMKPLPGRALEVALPGGACLTIADAAQAMLAAEFIAALNHVRVC
jgi:hypothetical protein